MTEWQPIDTAPRDTQILLFVPPSGVYIGEGWTDHTRDEKPAYFYDLEVGEIQPTHWMPLPAPPKKENE
jgi:hypothetical protein